MIKIKHMISVKNLFYWIIPFLCLASCSSDSLYSDEFGEVEKEGSATFFIGKSSGFGVGISTRAGEEEGNDGSSETSKEEVGTPLALEGLTYLLSDSQGRIIDHHYGSVEEDFSKVTLEGLKSGEYSIMFLGTVSKGANMEIGSPSEKSEPWLSNTSSDKPVNSIYCYKKLDFSIGFDHKPVNEKIELDLYMSRVNLDIEMSNITLWRHIKRVSLTIEDEMPSSLNADGSFGGQMHIKDFEIKANDGNYSFVTFPSEKPVKGYIDITSTREGGEDFTTRYSFTNLILQPGKISKIKLSYRHPEKESGRLYIAANQLWRFATDTMFMSDEPREIFYNAGKRSFYVNAPLQVSVQNNGLLSVKFYSPKKVKNVKILARFKKISSEWIELAYFEEIPEFMEGSFKLPVTETECIYSTTSGRFIRIPSQPSLNSSDVEVKFETDDEFMKKIATIDSRWYIRFSAYGADNGHAYWRHMNPLLCRHGVALALNMAFMFASPEFSAELDTYDGILKDNGGNNINLEALRRNIRNHAGLLLGRVAGVGGLGGGQTYGLADYCYTGVYHDATAPGSNPHNYARQAMFHEYGHCLGYSHASNMTYGDKWTVLCAKIFVQLGREGKLPVPNRTDVTNLPYQRN